MARTAETARARSASSPSVGLVPRGSHASLFTSAVEHILENARFENKEDIDRLFFSKPYIDIVVSILGESSRRKVEILMARAAEAVRARFEFKDEKMRETFTRFQEAVKILNAT